MTKDALQFLDRLEHRNRGAAVMDSLAEMVHRSNLQVGDKLPPELKLAKQLGVGRSTIREALNRWEGLDLIQRRRGVGTFLAAQVPKPGGPVDQSVLLEGEAILRLLEVRRVMEIAASRLAAERATQKQRDRIGELCDVLLGVVERRESYHEADEAFHRSISDASGNSLFSQLLEYLSQALTRSKDSPFLKTSFGLESMSMHREWADAVISGNPDRAEKAIENVIKSVEREISEIIGDQETSDS